MVWRDETFLSKLQCRVLVVGAGGIGCELLKNLALTGFSNIDVIDLDTIDVSNLNRQFLFRREHVGKSKAETAAQAVRSIMPSVNITCHHDSIMNNKYDVDFFHQFTVVLSALDNRAARNHVNRLCVAAHVPLVESGSSGYIGQVSVIIRDKTECYECMPKNTQKTYPGCTIRNTPTELIHCIVWAKHLFNQLFGEVDIDDDVSPDLENTRDADRRSSSNVGFNEQQSERNGTNSVVNGGAMEEDENGMDKNGWNEPTKECIRMWAARHNFDPKTLFHKFFREDIDVLLTLTDLWRDRRKPTPLEWNNLSNQNAGSSKTKTNEQIWSPFECREQFEKAVIELRTRVMVNTGGGNNDNSNKDNGSILVWDKDDDASMRFVAACGNIRAHIFGIPMKTLFDIKSMAGNIIPAIATTNAIVAGMIVVEAMKIVFGKMDKLKNVFISPKPNPRQQILVSEVPGKPNPKCYTCSEQRELIVKTNIKLTTVRSFEAKFLKGILNMVAPDAIIATNSNIIVSSEEGETDAIADRKLEEIGVVNGCLLSCDDFLQQFKVRVQVSHDGTLEVDQFEVIMDSGSETTNDGERSNGASTSLAAMNMDTGNDDRNKKGNNDHAHAIKRKSTSNNDGVNDDDESEVLIQSPPKRACLADN